MTGSAGGLQANTATVFSLHRQNNNRWRVPGAAELGGAAQPAVTLADGSSFPGPFLMSIDGPGQTNIFGEWHLWDLSQWPTVTPAVTRAINLSVNALADLTGTSSPLLPPDPDIGQMPLYRFVPNDTGIPEDVASFGTEVAYVANAPNIGLQALVPSQMNPQPLSDPQVQGTLYQQGQTVRAVSTVGEGDPSRSYVLAVEQGYGNNQMLLVDPQLSSVDHTPLVKATYALPGPALSVVGLTDWPAQLTPGDATSTTALELALVPCIGTGLCVTAVNPARGGFDDSLLMPGLGGVNQIRTPGRSPRGMMADPQTQLLLVADGTAGLTIIDLSTPGGSRDDDHDGIDDRVLGTVDLGGAQAQAVAVWRDPAGGLVAAIATGSSGVYVVRVTPSDPVALASINRSSGVCATLTAIDAQYGPYQKKFTEMEQARAATGQSPAVPPDMAATLVNDVPGLDDKTRGMDGAVADGLSRLVLRLEINAAPAPIGQVTFTLTSASSLASHHDTQFPFGTLSADGYTDPGTELTVDTQPVGGRLVAVAVYTPPTLFPYDPSNSDVQPDRADLLVTAADSAGNRLGRVSLRLVRPPVMVLHGLLGSAAGAVGPAFKRTLSRQALLMSFPDFSERNISGFDSVFDVIPMHVVKLRQVYNRRRNPDRDCEPPAVCLIQGNKEPIRGKSIALTKVDAVAHSMGGVLVRWYTTDQLGQEGTPPIARAIQYPLSAELGTIPAGPAYPWMRLSRHRYVQYRRLDNVMQGDLNSVIVYGAPLRGSPIANSITHDRCGDDRACYVFPPTLNTLDLQLALIFKGGLSGFSADDAGTAIYDLSIGSTAYAQLHGLASELVHVHAIGTTANDDNPLSARALTMLTSPAYYCPGFDETNSDRVVPLESQFGNIGSGTFAARAWHQAQDASRVVQNAIVGLLVDGTKLGEADPVTRFDARFLADPVYPLECERH